MKGYLSDHGAEILKDILEFYHPRTGGGAHLALPLVISVKSGWTYRKQGIVGRPHEADKLAREVAVEVLTGRNYWIQVNSPVEKLFECRTYRELKDLANHLTNGYTSKG